MKNTLKASITVHDAHPACRKQRLDMQSSLPDRLSISFSLFDEDNISMISHMLKLLIPSDEPAKYHRQMPKKRQATEIPCRATENTDQLLVIGKAKVEGTIYK